MNRSMGSYLLVVECTSDTILRTRGNKIFQIPKGEYLYVGSCGVNCSRILRHLFSKRRKLFWHIDYLLEKCSPKKAYIFQEISERKLASLLSRLGELEPVKNFGSSDDPENESHLFKLRSEISPEKVISLIISTFQDILR